MKISTKGRYALRLMLDLAEHREEGFVALKDIAKRQDISKKYLEQIVPLLNKSGVLRTTRGYQGGYMLAKAPDQYTVGDILRITEGSLAPVSCLEDEENLCPRAEDCITLGVWKGLNRVINEYLDSITLQTILDQNQSLAGDEYCI
ncbi:MAG: RrF2 family transcriptional regulator [Eubacterium sp.]